MSTVSEIAANDGSFVNRVRSLRICLEKAKTELDEYERLHSDGDCLEKLCAVAAELFPVLDVYFDELWSSFSCSDGEYAARKRLYEQELFDLLAEDIETNSYIREKPLGYAGDYVTMNYIYEYHDKNFLGGSLYAKLINRYTCNIDVARSNIARKEYIKGSILATLRSNRNASILSVGCGPAREIIELIKERKIERATIHLLDLEKKAILYIQNQLAGISYDKTKIDIHFHMMDLMEVVKNPRFLSLFPNIDLLYASGVFDYLSSRVARRVFARLFAITKKDLLVFNMALEHARHRAYYEVFGGWLMNHRSKEELLTWGKGLLGVRCFSVESPPDCNSYWILKARKT